MYADVLFTFFCFLEVPLTLAALLIPNGVTFGAVLGLYALGDVFFGYALDVVQRRRLSGGASAHAVQKASEPQELGGSAWCPTYCVERPPSLVAVLFRGPTSRSMPEGLPFASSSPRMSPRMTRVGTAPGGGNFYGAAVLHKGETTGRVAPPTTPRSPDFYFHTQRYSTPSPFRDQLVAQSSWGGALRVNTMWCVHWFCGVLLAEKAAEPAEDGLGSMSPRVMQLLDDYDSALIEAQAPRDHVRAAVGAGGHFGVQSVGTANAGPAIHLFQERRITLAAHLMASAAALLLASVCVPALKLGLFALNPVLLGKRLGALVALRLLADLGACWAFSSSTEELQGVGRAVLWSRHRELSVLHAWLFRALVLACPVFVTLAAALF